MGEALKYINDESAIEVCVISFRPAGVQWLDDAYRTVTFLESPTGDFLTWLQANAVKQ